MPRPKRDEVLRHETPTEEVYVNYHDDEEGFMSTPAETRDSGVVVVPAAKRGRGKRSVEDMMASMPNEMTQSIYALERVAAAEDQIEKVLALCSPEALALVLKQRPSLRKYVKEQD